MPDTRARANSKARDSNQSGEPMNRLRFLVCLCILGTLAGHAPLADQTPARGQRSQESLRFTKKQLMVDPYESCTVADINRDGHLDIVYGAHWFAGPDFLPHAIRPNHASREYIRTNSDHL